MERADFVAHTDRALADAVAYAEEKLGVRMPNRLCVAIGFDSKDAVCSGMAEYVVSRVYEAPDRIRPCVDLIVSELLEGDRVLIRVIVAGYPPAKFGRNWSGREGPYVFGYSERLKAQLGASR